MTVWERDAGSQPLKPEYWLGRLDLRPIALFRIGLGLFVIFDILDFAPNLAAWFSDDGVLPRSAMLGNWARATRLCLMDAFGSPQLVWVYWAISLVAAIAMTIGYRTRLASVVTFLLMAGYQERIPPLFDGSDTVLRVVLFWHMFTDSGNLWSIDAHQARVKGAPLDGKGPAFPIRLTGLQIGWVYFCSVFYKAQGATWHSGTALHYCLRLSHVFAHPWAASIADFMPLVRLGTYATLVVEATFIFLCNFPIFHTKAKAAALLSGLALHLGILLTINVGHFSVLMPTTYLCMFEASWAQKVAGAFTATGLGRGVLARLEALRLPVPVAPWRIPATWTHRQSRLTLGLGIFFGLVSWYSMPHPLVPQVPHSIEVALQYSSMWSNWDMFAPEPLRTDYHLRAPADFEDGSTADLFGGPKGGPGELRGLFFTRWWKYLENVTGGNETLPLEWGRYLCRERNFHLAPGEPRLYTFTLFKDNQIIPPVGQPWPPVEKQSVWVHRCFDKPSDRPSNQQPPPRPAIAIETPAH